MSTNNRLTTQQRDEVDTIINDHTERVDDIVNKNVMIGATAGGFVAFITYFLIAVFTDNSMTWWGAIGWIVFGALIGVVVGAFKKPQVSTTVTEGRFERQHEPAMSEQQVTEGEPSLLGTVLKYGLIIAGIFVLVYLARVLLSSSDWHWGMAAVIALYGFGAAVAYGALEYTRRQGSGGSDTKLFGVIFGIAVTFFALFGAAMALELPLYWFIYIFIAILGAIIGYRRVVRNAS